jgi:alkaline phosphatase
MFGKKTTVAAWTMLAFVMVLASAGCATAPKHVILFIGDGMGPEEVKAAGMYANGEAGTLFFERFPVQTVVITDNAGGTVTDSAAAGTAISTGRKVNNSVLSKAIPGDGSDLETMLEYYQKRGKSTGLVTTSFITDATPAAFASHADKRGDFNDIVADYLHVYRPNVLMGGNRHIKADEARKAGYTVVTNRDEFFGLDTNVALAAGLFGKKGTMPYLTDPNSGKYPGISEMTIMSIKLLERDPDGFFLMVEGGNIDHAGHVNKLLENVSETMAFDEAVAAAMEWAKDRKDVLIVVAADHETGGLTVVQNNGKGNLPGVTWANKKHSGAPVPLYAWGKGAVRLALVQDNTQIRAAITGESSKKLEARSQKEGGSSKQEEKTEEKDEEYSTSQGKK